MHYKYYLLLCIFLFVLNIHAQSLERFQTERDKTIIELFNKKYNSKLKKKNFFATIIIDISNSNFGEFDNTTPYERKLAYWLIDICYLGIEKSTLAKKNKSTLEILQQVALLTTIKDTNIIRNFCEQNKSIFLENINSSIIQKIDIDWVINDLLKCYQRLALLDDKKILEYQNNYHFLHWGYTPAMALKDKTLKFYKLSFYIEWLYIFWINKKKQNNDVFFYQIINNLSKNIKLREEKYPVWNFDNIGWGENIKK